MEDLGQDIDSDDEEDERIPKTITSILDDNRKHGKQFGNVISLTLFEFDELNSMPDPLLHILMGLVNDNLKEILKESLLIKALLFIPFL